MSHSVSTVVNSGNPKLLDQVRDAIRLKHYSIRTEQTYSRLDPAIYSFPRQTASLGNGRRGGDRISYLPRPGW